MKNHLILLFLAIYVSAEITLETQLESLYFEMKYNELENKLHELNGIKSLNASVLGIVYRIKGHLCFFGKNVDSNVNIQCAWRNYVYSAKYGDPEGLFFTALFLDNLMFESLDPLKEYFDRNIDLIESASDINEKIQALKALTHTMYSLASAAGCPLASMRMGNMLSKRNDRSLSVAEYYFQAADKLFPYFVNKSVSDFSSKLIISSATSPYEIDTRNVDAVKLIRLLEIINEVYNNIGIYDTSTLLKSYINYKEYDLAKALAEKVSSDDPAYSYASYVMGLINVMNKSGDGNYTLAYELLRNSSDSDAYNLLGYLYLEGIYEPVHSYITEDYLRIG